MQAVKNNANGFSNSVWNILTCINCGISTVYSFLQLSKASTTVAILVGLMSIPAAVINKRYVKKLFECRIKLAPDARMLGYLQSITAQKAHAEDIRMFGFSDEIIKKYENSFQKIIREENSIHLSGTVARAAFDGFSQFYVCLALLGLVYNICSGNMTVGDYSLYTGLISTLVASMSQLIYSITGIYEDRLKILSIIEFLDRKNLIKDTGTFVLSEIHDIEFKHVFFCYPSSKDSTIHDLSVQIHAGEKIGIVGMNGAGKSTLIKLLLRFYDVTSGIILINGKDIKQYTLESLRMCFSTMFQTYDTYAFSLRENIVFSNYSSVCCSDKSVYEALSEVAGDNVLEKVKFNLDISVTKLFDPTGVEFSGGEKQKIGLARALLRKSSVIILDEPSAALDPFAENKLLDCIVNHSSGKIILFTAHRLSTIAIADRIIVIEGGTAVETGSHNELLCKHGKYADIYEAQAQSFKQDQYEH